MSSHCAYKHHLHSTVSIAECDHQIIQINRCFGDQIALLFVHELRYFARMKIKVESCTMVAEWAWDVKEGDDVCGICHSAYDGCCPNCKRPGDDCPLVWGECSHVFHLHCILTWFRSSTRGESCPMDRTPWQTAKAPLE